MTAERLGAAGSVEARRSDPASYVPGLDGYRAIAALMVLIFHVAAATGVTAGPDVAARLTGPLGGLGVCIFFVLSGFLMYRPFVTAHLHDQARPPLGRYFVRRFLRIYPAYWLALLFYLYVFGSPGETIRDGGDLVAFLTLQHGYDRNTLLAGVPVAWTLTVEVAFYVFLPAFAALVVLLAGPKANHRDRMYVQLAAIVGLAALSATTRVLLIESGSDLTRIFPAMADWFATGMLIALLRVWFDDEGTRPPVFAALRTRPEIGLVGALIAFAAVLALDVPRGFVALGLGDEMARSALFAVIGFCLVAPVALGTSPTRPILKVLEHPLAVWFGVISYGVYLWHILVIRELRPELVERFGVGAGFWPTLVITIVGTTGIAATSWYLLERPIIAWGRGQQRPWSGVQS